MSGRTGGNRYSRPKAPRRGVNVSLRGLGSIVKYSILILCSFAFFTVVSMGLFAGYRWMTSADMFKLEEIEVRGSRYMSYNDVLEASGLHVGLNALGVKMRDVEQGLQNNPWVMAATVKRELPHKISISLQERQPCFWRRQGDDLFFADTAGQIIAPLKAESFKGLPMLEMEEGAEDLLPVYLSMRARARSMGLPFDMERAAWVKLRSDMSIEMFFDSREMLVVLDSKDWERNLDCLRRSWTDLVRRGEHGDVLSMTAHGAKVWVARKQGKKA